MPTFDYQCKACGQVSEVFVKNASNPEPPACAACGSKDVKRLLSAPRGHVTGSTAGAATCCGRDTPCQVPPCAGGGPCRR